MRELRDDEEWVLEVWHRESIFRGIIEAIKKYICDYFCDCGSCPLNIPNSDRCMKTEFEKAVNLAKEEGLKENEIWGQAKIAEETRERIMKNKNSAQDGI